jgi:transposase
MTEEAKELFDALARQDVPDRDAGPARYVEAQRDAIVFERFEFDALVETGHPARVVWGYVERLDLSGLYGLIRARAHTPGRPPPDPRVVLALWLYACIEGVGSARQLERLSEEHHGFRWLRGGVPLNYHLLPDFRWQAAAVADRLLTEGVAALWSEGLIDLASLSHDGVRIRASAGASSFRRLATLKRLLGEVEARIVQLKQEIDAAPDASNRRQRAARERSLRERQERIGAALQALQELKTEPPVTQKPEAGGPDNAPPPSEDDKDQKKEPRRSTTDSQARVMRMPDGGWRPAYNVQLTADPRAGVIVGLDVDTTGSDGGLMAPAAKQIEQRYAHRPHRWLVDGGFTRLGDIVTLARNGITVFCPLKPRRNPAYDPAMPRYGDPPEVAAWRRRMVDDAAAGPASWMRRRAEHERINANFRRQGLQQFNVTGIFKVRTVCLLHAIANNLMAAHRLKAAAA